MSKYNKLNKFMIEEFLKRTPYKLLAKEGSSGNLKARFKLENGNINFYSNGSITTDGKEALKLSQLLDHWNDTITNLQKTIFIVYAFQNRKKKDEVQQLLLEWGFKVEVMEDRAGNGVSLLNKLEKSVAKADYGIVLLSPDIEIEPGKFLPRPNVMMELGMLLGYLKDVENRISIINYKTDKADVEIASDILGVAYEEYNPATIATKLMNEVYHLYEFDGVIDY
ncbi:TIR domain-containing protein [Streptococcus suis]|uniref:TIR domain-containing protein n=1 Tax=Streptococcus suis TaxID=1307 RepID=UPI00300FDF4C